MSSASEPRLIHGLEVWLLGTRSQIEAAAAALRDVLPVPERIEPQAGIGCDVGRFRLYLRGYPRDRTKSS